LSLLSIGDDRAVSAIVSNVALLPLARTESSRLESRVKRYLDKAEECERLAAHAQDPDIKAALVSIAQQWRKLARQIERLERDQ
jgi:hypothetical protein